jgi:hypothetical protein
MPRGAVRAGGKSGCARTPYLRRRFGFRGLVSFTLSPHCAGPCVWSWRHLSPDLESIERQRTVHGTFGRVATLDVL